jgi:hypothetical protein
VLVEKPELPVMEPSLDFAGLESWCHLVHCQAQPAFHHCLLLHGLQHVACYLSLPELLLLGLKMVQEIGWFQLVVANLVLHAHFVEVWPDQASPGLAAALSFELPTPHHEHGSALPNQQGIPL